MDTIQGLVFLSLSSFFEAESSCFPRTHYVEHTPFKLRDISASEVLGSKSPICVLQTKAVLLLWIAYSHKTG